MVVNRSPWIGLCAGCRHVNVIKSSKGSAYILCGLAKVDRRLSKYPVLPVIECLGFDKRLNEEESPDLLENG
jgi:hypothetical protein